ncbi:MAG: hypothetical protein VB064_12995 [Oscillospiraceae bacterium]|nr:hypothetical protein [Oscillospiraceae bacterium]
MFIKNFEPRNDTKTCHRFECREESGEFTTLYLKKQQIKDAGLDPTKPIKVTITQEENT